ncbi:MAG: nucleotide exchange factor GrpE [Alistipes sp.]|jgi:molecular chaperone GrpE|nr:nucleotide exchange factor GrpE [Alistipes sp.]
MRSSHNKYRGPENKQLDIDEEIPPAEDCTEDDGAVTDNLSGQTDTVSPADAPTELTPEEEVAVWRDKFVRLSAEFDNYRKRTTREKIELIAVGGEDVVRLMLDVLDDMDRALEAMVRTDDLAAVRQGIVLIDTKLRGALRSRGLAEIEAVDQQLDTDLHEAVARIETDDAERKGKIIDVVQKGYKLNDKIIRYAKVVVGQ